MSDPISDLADGLREAQTRLLDLAGPHRQDLFSYCRRLTGSLWDAEDLVQEALLRLMAAYARAWQEPPPVRQLLFRIATHAWIDRVRRTPHQLRPLDPMVADEPSGPDPVVVTEAVERLFLALPPRERAAVALIDALGLDAAEAAACMGGTPGAVRVALHRGRQRLRQASVPPLPDRPVPDPIVTAFCAAFSRRDIAACAALLVSDARCDVLGCVTEFGRDAIINGSLAHTMAEAGDPEAAPVVIDGELSIAIRYRTHAGRAVGDLVRVMVDDGAIVRLEHAFFCPELLDAAAAQLSEPVRLNGWRYGGHA